MDKVAASLAPAMSATYVCVGHLLFDFVAAIQRAIGPVAKEVLGDIPNFTTITPITQISEVVL